jgi:uncharacterized protein YjbJ (UPF0337 family)
MSSTMDKAKGVGNEIVGGAKRKIGEAAGSGRLEAEGAAQELKGAVQKKVGEAKDAVRDAADRLDDAVNRNT